MGIASQIITNASIKYSITLKPLSVDLAVEIYSDKRKYPSDYTSEMILADQTSNLAKLTMAAVEIDGMDGIEGQIAHSENGMTRSYGDNPVPKAYATVCCIVNF